MFKNKRAASARLEKLKNDFQISALKAAEATDLSKQNKKESTKSLENKEETHRCICHRKPKTLVCINCKMLTYGRITQMCREHVNVTFLMDFNCCPNCLGPKHLMRGVDEDGGIFDQATTNKMCYEDAAAANGSLHFRTLHL